MPTDIVLRESSDLQNIEVTATDVSAIPAMQASVLHWARKKLDLVKAELNDCLEVEDRAWQKGYKVAAHTRMRLRAEKRVMFYEKVIIALEAGYVIFPSMNAEIFAVRVDKKRPRPQGRTEIVKPYRSIPVFEEPTKALPAGKGRYVAPVPTVEVIPTDDVIKKDATGQLVAVAAEYFRTEDFDQIEFPIEMAKPEIIDVTDRAMTLKVFDEMGILPPKWGRNGDPVIVGNILYPNDKYKKLSFLIAWHIDTKGI